MGKLLYSQMVKQLLLVQERLPFCVEMEQGSQLLSLPYSL